MIQSSRHPSVKTCTLGGHKISRDLVQESGDDLSPDLRSGLVPLNKGGIDGQSLTGCEGWDLMKVLLMQEFEHGMRVRDDAESICIKHELAHTLSFLICNHGDPRTLISGDLLSQLLLFTGLLT